MYYRCQKGLRGVHSNKSAANICKLRQWRSQQLSCLAYIVLDDRLPVIDCNMIYANAVSLGQEKDPLWCNWNSQQHRFWKLFCCNRADGIGQPSHRIPDWVEPSAISVSRWFVVRGPHKQEALDNQPGFCLMEGWAWVVSSTFCWLEFPPVPRPTVYWPCTASPVEQICCTLAGIEQPAEISSRSCSFVSILFWPPLRRYRRHIEADFNATCYCKCFGVSFASYCTVTDCQGLPSSEVNILLQHVSAAASWLRMTASLLWFQSHMFLLHAEAIH